MQVVNILLKIISIWSVSMFLYQQKKKLWMIKFLNFVIWLARKSSWVELAALSPLLLRFCGQLEHLL